MPDYMCYSGEVAEVFGWTPAGTPIPRVCARVPGERVGDHAFVDERAMYWDGRAWLPLPWKDFAVWTTAEAVPRHRNSFVADFQNELDQVLGVDGQIDFDGLPTGDHVEHHR